jgi:hypothetical protein
MAGDSQPLRLTGCFLARPPAHAVGQEETIATGRFGASKLGLSPNANCQCAGDFTDQSGFPGINVHS